MNEYIEEVTKADINLPMRLEIERAVDDGDMWDDVTQVVIYAFTVERDGTNQYFGHICL